MFYEAIGASDPLFVNNVGRDCDGTFSCVAWNFAAKTAANDDFSRSYRAAFKREPDYHSAANYSAIQVLVAAIKHAGAVDNAKIRDALATIRIPTLVGTYRVDPNTGIQLGYTSFIIQWQNGKQVVVYPGNVAN